MWITDLSEKFQNFLVRMKFISCSGLAWWKWAASGKRTKRRNDRYVELGWVGEDRVRGGEGGVEVCLHALERQGGGEGGC